MRRVDAAVDLTQNKEIQVFVIESFAFLEKFQEESGQRREKEECSYGSENDLAQQFVIKVHDAVFQHLLIGHSQAGNGKNKQNHGKDRMPDSRLLIFRLCRKKIDQFISGNRECACQYDNNEDQSKIDKGLHK